MTQIRPERPSADEIEVSFFGPGFGESIVIHAGDDNWIVVDSCIDAPSSRPAALAYLEEIGVDPSTAVKLILTTHWHDDHIGGMSELVKTCLSAKFACSMALTRREFIEVATVYTTRPLVRGTSGVTEIRETFETLKKRHQVPVHATADRPLFRVRREPAGDVTWDGQRTAKLSHQHRCLSATGPFCDYKVETPQSHAKRGFCRGLGDDWRNQSLAGGRLRRTWSTE